MGSHSEHVGLAYQDAALVLDEDVLPLEVDSDRLGHFGERRTLRDKWKQCDAAAQRIEADEMFLFQLPGKINSASDETSKVAFQVRDAVAIDKKPPVLVDRTKSALSRPVCCLRGSLLIRQPMKEFQSLNGELLLVPKMMSDVADYRRARACRRPRSIKDVEGLMDKQIVPPFGLCSGEHVFADRRATDVERTRKGDPFGCQRLVDASGQLVGMRQAPPPQREGDDFFDRASDTLR